MKYNSENTEIIKYKMNTSQSGMSIETIGTTDFKTWSFICKCLFDLHLTLWFNPLSKLVVFVSSTSWVWLFVLESPIFTCEL